MCTNREFDNIYKVLKNKELVKVEPLDASLFRGIKDKDILDGLIRLKFLGFARSINYLNGESALEITNQGKNMYKTIY